MSLFEIIGELFNPGPIGKVDFDDTKFKMQKRFMLLRFIVSLLLIGLFEYIVLRHNRELSHILIVNVLLVIYLIIALVINVKPDYDNLGWVPFLINNPFRYSDNINRLLVMLDFFFLPGKYISRCILEFYFFMREKL